MPRVTHFELPAKDPNAIAAFYTAVFGWTFTKWEGPVDYWLVGTGPDDQPGIDGGLYTPQEGWTGTINTLDVDNLDACLIKVKANGGQVVADKMPVPGVGWLAYCRDVEGTIFGLMQSDPKAGL